IDLPSLFSPSSLPGFFPAIIAVTVHHFHPDLVITLFFLFFFFNTTISCIHCISTEQRLCCKLGHGLGQGRCNLLLHVGPQEGSHRARANLCRTRRRPILVVCHRSTSDSRCNTLSVFWPGQIECEHARGVCLLLCTVR